MPFVRVAARKTKCHACGWASKHELIIDVRKENVKNPKYYHVRCLDGVDVDNDETIAYHHQMNERDIQRAKKLLHKHATLRASERGMQLCRRRLEKSDEK